MQQVPLSRMLIDFKLQLKILYQGKNISTDFLEKTFQVEFTKTLLRGKL